MASGLPEDGELRIGSITLPRGRRLKARYGSGAPVAWATLEPVSDAGGVWAALSGEHSHTGLVPILLKGLDETAERPWDEEEFEDPADVTQLERMDAANVLRDMWDGTAYEVGFEDDDEEDEDEMVLAMRAPFSKQFPGLAPAAAVPLSKDQLTAVLGALPAARIGLVPASRPADVLPLLGWSGAANSMDTALPIAAVLRSWEERFGAQLLEVGFAEIRLLVERPPRSYGAAQRLAAEQFAFCDECSLGDQTGLRDVGMISSGLVNAPLWGFWWD
jgi:hypothetical protein